MSVNLKKLAKTERFCLDSLQNLAHLVEKYDEARDRDMLEGWLERLTEVFEEFQETRLSLETSDQYQASLKQRLEAEELEQTKEGKTVATLSMDQLNLDTRTAFECTYLKVRGFIKSKLRTQGQTIPQPAAVNPVQQVRVKLPEIKLPIFDGTIREWSSFRDAFRSLIDSNPQLSDVDKFSYLLSSLSKDAKRVIEVIEVTSANYFVAWELLEKRYENKYLIVKAYVEALFMIDPIKRECHEALNRLIDAFERNLKMLEKAGEEPEYWSTLLVFMVSARLDPVTLRHWETHRKSTAVPTYTEIIEFLRSHSLVLQSVDASKSRPSDSSRPPSQRSTSLAPKQNVAHSAVTAQKCCPFCKLSAHSPYQCEAFRKMTPSQRFDATKKNALCINCLSPSHIVKTCTSGTCRVCQQRHHTMLHQRTTAPATQSGQPSTKLSSSDFPSSSSSSSSSHPPAAATKKQALPAENQAQATAVPAPQTSHFSMPFAEPQVNIPVTVLLSTALVKVFTSSGSFVWARALLDSGSQLNFVSEHLTQQLKLRRDKEFVPISGVGLSSTSSKHSTIIRIQSHQADFEDNWKFHVLPKLTLELPNQAVEISTSSWPSDIVLADPSFNKPGPIDLIFGVDIFYDLLRNGQIKHTSGTPILQNTALGWVVSGKGHAVVPATQVANFAHVSIKPSIEELLARFWEVESCNIQSTYSLEEAECEEFFKQTTTRDSSGRFIVALPTKPSVISQLGNSKDIADRRFYALERRLNVNLELKEAYSNFMREYEQMGHMKLVDDSLPCSGPTYYIPHHCIVRPDSLTTKLRVVFDASCQTDSGHSLNDALRVGPVIQDDLHSMVLRFRIPRFAIIADFEKMFRQFRIRESDQPLLSIRWRYSPSNPLQTFRLTTVTYGTSSAPYLATRCLKQLSEEGSESHPAAAVVLGRDFYMDDMLTGVDSVEEGQKLCEEMLELTSSAGLLLRKWASNNPAILSSVPSHLRDERTLFELDSAAAPIKALGLQWDASADVLQFQVPQYSTQLPVTKQSVLSDIARLFDPLGLVGPLLVQAKLFLQDLWRGGCEWKEPLAESRQREWLELRDSFRHLPDIKIPRWVVATFDVVCLEIHGFSDASERAYGACIYIRAVSSTGSIHVNLLTAKSKIAPKGKSKAGGIISLPRLELCAALLLSHLFEKVESSLNLKVKNFFWTDSEITLYQIAANPSRWKTFVANRCSEIQRITANGTWSHVPGSENPADIISRGMSPAELRDCSAWWKGPDWLSQPSRFWPHLGCPRNRSFSSEELEERTVSLPAQIHPTNELFLRYSSYTKLIRIVALLQRFRFNTRARSSSDRLTGFLSTTETNEAERLLVKLAQNEVFAVDIAEINRNEQVKPNSRLKSLSPVLVDGVLRVGGRLRHAPVSYDQRHPMILPDKHPLTELIMVHYHRKLLHAGPQFLTAAVRERFWPLRIRNLARQVVHACITCFRCKPKVLEQLMGELPVERVTPAFPFQHTGVDYCGPFSCRPTRRATAVKCYVAVFVCLATKAVHLECVGDLTTHSFIAALRRFIARRGKPTLIECDNALNFQGAKRELQELARLFRSQQHQDQVTRSCSDDGISFKFIPPRSPNFGGLWEAAVKSMKNHLRRTVGNATLYHEDFVTLLVQIESLLNSRPLTQLTSDPNDLEVLTPGHFLVHRSLTAIPEPSLADVPTNRLDRYQQTQEYVRRIWQQWQSEYLSGLQPRTRWTQRRNNIDVGTLVLVKEENLPPLKWSVGRITKVFRGDDNCIRVVDVRTKDGEYRRGISKICVLPIQPESGVAADQPEGQ